MKLINIYISIYYVNTIYITAFPLRYYYTLQTKYNTTTTT